MKLENWQREILKKGNIYQVGGRVRDKLIDPRSKPKDIDYLISGIPMEEISSILKRFGKVDFVGKSFGVIKFKPRGKDVIYDIVLPRKEFSIGPKHKDFRIIYDHRMSIEEDLERRDFTINAIAFDIKRNRYIDPFDGISDIKKRILRFISERSFIEDPLRMLRAVQFSARFQLKIERNTLISMKKNANRISYISPERIQEEIVKLITKSEKPSKGFKIMYQTGLLKIILPELEETKKIKQDARQDLFLHSIRACDAAPMDNLAVRLAALLHDIGKPKKKKIITDKRGRRVVFYNHERLGSEMASELLRRLRFPNEIIEKVCHLILNHMFDYTSQWSDSAVRRFILRVGKENIEDIFLLRAADRVAMYRKGFDRNLIEFRSRIDAEINRSLALSVRDLAVDGNDVMRVLNISPGPKVGEVLARLLEMVTENPSLNSRELLIDEIIKMGKI